jgi:hypothetical protein
VPGSTLILIDGVLTSAGDFLVEVSLYSKPEFKFLIQKRNSKVVTIVA